MVKDPYGKVVTPETKLEKACPKCGHITTSFHTACPQCGTVLQWGWNPKKKIMVAMSILIILASLSYVVAYIPLVTVTKQAGDTEIYEEVEEYTVMEKQLVKEPVIETYIEKVAVPTTKIVTKQVPTLKEVKYTVMAALLLNPDF